MMSSTGISWLFCRHNEIFRFCPRNRYICYLADREFDEIDAFRQLRPHSFSKKLAFHCLTRESRIKLS